MLSETPLPQLHEFYDAPSCLHIATFYADPDGCLIRSLEITMVRFKYTCFPPPVYRRLVLNHFLIWTLQRLNGRATNCCTLLQSLKLRLLPRYLRHRSLHLVRDLDLPPFLQVLKFVALHILAVAGRAIFLVPLTHSCSSAQICGRSRRAIPLNEIIAI